MLFLLRDFRLLGLLPVALAAFLALAPSATDGPACIRTFSLKDRSNVDRVAMMKSGLRIIKDDPLTGVGPDMMIQVYPALPRQDGRQPAEPAPAQRAAADRGRARAAGAAVWLWFIVTLVRDFCRRRTIRVPVALQRRARGDRRRCSPPGLFEYNFGDSEFLMLFLVLVTLPYAAERAPARPPPEAPCPPRD